MSHQSHQCHCCPQCVEPTQAGLDFSRRTFLAMGGIMLGGLTLSGLQTGLLAADADNPILLPNPRKPLIVKPILVHDLPVRKEATSWRHWGGIETQEQAEKEVGRISTELAALKAKADYPIEFLDVAAVTDINQMKEHPDIAKCDTILLYGAGYNCNGIRDFGKDVIVFLRWRSDPVYLQWECISTHHLRQFTDNVTLPGICHADVVSDKMEELDWRFRALCGLKNTMASKIVTVGGTRAWGAMNREEVQVILERVKKTWKFELHNVDYDELSKLIVAAKDDDKVMARAKLRAETHLKIPGTKLETAMDFLVYGFVLDEIFRLLMKKVDANSITIHECMSTVMPILKSTACYSFSTLIDDGYTALCESDFVSMPSGMLLHNITGKPVFMCNQTYPSENLITVAHCTAPRKMDGKNYDPVRIVTHFESDYGAAPWVQAPLGTTVTTITAAQNGDRWTGFKGKIVAVPFRPICRTQFEIQFECPTSLLAERIPGQHCMTCYGDYRKEIDYALRRVGIRWENLDEASS